MEMKTLLKMSVNSGLKYNLTGEKGGEKTLLIDLCLPDESGARKKVPEARYDVMLKYLERMGKPFEYAANGTCLKIIV